MEDEMGKRFGASPIRERGSRLVQDGARMDAGTTGVGRGSRPVQESTGTGVQADARPAGYYMDNPCEEVFTCAVCGYEVHPEGAASEHRNHCPNCLSSLHLDNIPGDRASDCHGVMEPIAVWVRDDGEWALIHRCKKCGHLSSNRSAADDNPARLMAIARKPVDNPPFPIDRIDDMMRSLGYEE